MKYFVCADIHGFYDEWIKSLSEKGFDLNNKEHKIIICGDLFDRGHKPREIIDFILSNQEKFILIRGNHEDLIEEMIDRNFSIRQDEINGTNETIIDLCPEWQKSEFSLRKIANETGLQKILDLCQNYYETKHYVFVHGWIPVIEEYDENVLYKYDTDWRISSKASWQQARWKNPTTMFKLSIYEPEKVIVCGHWHCSALWHEQNPETYEEFGEKANFEPFITDKMIALDACTVYSHKVNVVVLED